MASLWISPSDLSRLEASKASVQLIGGYDGSGNFGDVLQLATAIETARRTLGAPLPVAVIERETRSHHLDLLRRYPDALGGATFAFFDDGSNVFGDELLELERGALPGRTALYLYGGGYLNESWGARKVAHSQAVERLAGRRLAPVASGLQVDEATVRPGGVAHGLLKRAKCIGVRDADSLRHVHSHICDARLGRAELGGDDAVPFFDRGAGRAGSVVNLHLNDGVWVSEDPQATIHGLVDFLIDLAGSVGGKLELQPIIAYEDPRVSERQLVSAFLDRHGARLQRVGIEPIEPVDICDDLLRADLARFRRARMTVACSYHVTLASLMTGTPAVLAAHNRYYEQKAAGLRDLFALDGGLIGVRGSADDASAAAEAWLAGTARTALLGKLQDAGASLADRHRKSRDSLESALDERLRESASRTRSLRSFASRVGRSAVACHA